MAEDQYEVSATGGQQIALAKRCRDPWLLEAHSLHRRIFAELKYLLATTFGHLQLDQRNDRHLSMATAESSLSRFVTYSSHTFSMSFM